VFAFDGRWRLEGKMLAGCVGELRTGTDTLLLPRLTDRGGSLFVRLANLAPETDYVTHASLAAVPLSGDEELDISVTGGLVAWRPQREIPVALPPAVDGESVATVNLAPEAGSEIIVLEVRNTFAFETEMKRFFLEGMQPNHRPDLTVEFGNGRTEVIQPVGTKFLRRVVVAMPKPSDHVTLRAEGGFWYTRRLWLGTCRPCDAQIVWQKPLNSYSKRLSPMQQTELEFPGRSHEVGAIRRYGYALRLRGYYDFVESR